MGQRGRAIIIRQPNTASGLPTPDISSDLEEALGALQAAFTALGVKHFTAKEFGLLWRANWTGPPQQLPVDPFFLARTALLLDWIREDFGLALNPGSTFRPMAYNTADGQSSGSQHLWGRASDVRPTPKNNTAKNRRRLYDLIRRNLGTYRTRLAEAYCVPEKSIKFGLKIYSGFAHVDVSFIGEPGCRSRDWLPAPQH